MIKTLNQETSLNNRKLHICVVNYQDKTGYVLPPKNTFDVERKCDM